MIPFQKIKKIGITWHHCDGTRLSGTGSACNITNGITHILALLINSTEAGNLLRGNGAVHAMLGARTRARVQLVLVTMIFICLIARLLVQATPQSY
jgi:hypothetical protein